MAKVDDDQIGRIEALVERIAQIPDRSARETAEQLMESVLAFHGSGLERMMELVFESGQAGEAMIRRFANDSLVSSLLILHGLHPDDMETRVRQALAKLPGHAELLGVFEGVVRVRIAAEGGCSAKESAKAILRDAIPDAQEIVLEEGVQINTFVPLAALGALASRTG